MIAMVLFVVFALPLCACVAGVVVWLSDCSQPLDDGQLYWSFMAILVMGMMLLLGISRTTTVRMALDPNYRLQTELDAHPLYSAMQRLDSTIIDVSLRSLQSEWSRGLRMTRSCRHVLC